MDMEMALAMYQKDIAEWRNNMPTDLAAKMTRDKLYNLFPDVEQDTLLELLMAHDNNFNATVEVIFVFTSPVLKFDMYACASGLSVSVTYLHLEFLFYFFIINIDTQYICEVSPVNLQ